MAVVQQIVLRADRGLFLLPFSRSNWMPALFRRRDVLTLLVALSVGSGAYALTLMTWNVSGNGVADWSTNAVQVQAIGRQVAALNPDIITFNEIPRSKTYE